MRENHSDEQTDQNALRHIKTKKRLKTAGWILLCAGIVLSAFLFWRRAADCWASLTKEK